MKIQITIDEDCGSQIKLRAKELGLSISSYSRYMLKDSLKTRKLKKLDIALLEPSELITPEEFKKQLGVKE